jgi:hypothetical protein
MKETHDNIDKIISTINFDVEYVKSHFMQETVKFCNKIETKTLCLCKSLIDSAQTILYHIRDISLMYQKTVLEIQFEVNHIKECLKPLWMETKKKVDCMDTFAKVLSIHPYNKNKYINTEENKNVENTALTISVNNSSNLSPHDEKRLNIIILKRKPIISNLDPSDENYSLNINIHKLFGVINLFDNFINKELDILESKFKADIQSFILMYKITDSTNLKYIATFENNVFILFRAFSQRISKTLIKCRDKVFIYHAVMIKLIKENIPLSESDIDFDSDYIDSEELEKF